jgi:hypothetical protein
MNGKDGKERGEGSSAIIGLIGKRTEETNNYCRCENVLQLVQHTSNCKTNLERVSSRKK